MTIVILGIVSALVWGVSVGFARKGVAQPIAFNHHLHVAELEVACDDCHVHAIDGVRATIPNIEICGGCHEEALTESPEEVRLVEYVRKEEWIPWRRVYWVPNDVYFSHRRHTRLGEIECRVCHGEMKALENPLHRPLVRLAMDDCIECHDERGAPNDCVLCHE